MVLACALILLGPSYTVRAEQNPPVVSLVEHHQSPWRIVSPSADRPGVACAVSELRKYIELISEAKLSVTNQPGEGAMIVIGLRQDLSTEDQAALPAPAKGYDGYSVTIRAGVSPRIIVSGDNGRGVIYGVYDVLERLGCRWFYPVQDPKDPETLPHQSDLKLAAGAWSVASSMKHRIYNGDAWFWDIQPDKAIAQVDHAMKLRCNLMGWQCAVDKPLTEQYRRLRETGVLAELEKRDLALHGPAHSFNLFLPNELFTNHPNWFGLRDGKRVPQNFFGAQFCWSNPEARKAFVENVTVFARQSPLMAILAIVPFDGGKACDCAVCRQAGASNCLMELMNEVIDAVEACRPGLLVETVGGYAPIVEPPTGVRIHPHQRIAWAHWGRYMAYGYGDPRYDNKKNLEAWKAAAHGGVTVVQYYSDNFAEPWVMPPFAQAIQGDRKYLLAQGIDSIYFLIYPPGCWWNHSLNTYLSSRCFYDAALDPFELLQDYALRYYGPKAGPLLAQYYRQWAQDPDLGYHIRGGTTRHDREVLAQQRASFIDPAVRATQDDPLYAHRVSKVAGLHTLAERLAEGHHLRHQIQLARHQGQFEQAARLLETARVYADAIMGCFYDLAERNEGLIDKNEVPGFIKMGVKNWLDAEAQALARKDTQINENEVQGDLDERSPKQ